MKNPLFRWTSGAIRPPRWMAFSHYSAERNLFLWVAFPLNLAVSVAFWIQDQWARAANAPSWIEREVQARLNFDHSTFTTKSTTP